MLLSHAHGTACRLQTLLRAPGPAVSLIRAFAAQAAKPAPQGKGASKPQQQAQQKRSGEQKGAAAAPAAAFVETSVDPLRPSTIVIQLKAKAIHPYYLNRYAAALGKKFTELGLPKPGQVFLPMKTERWTVLKSPHVDKKAREQFERITHKRLFQFKLPDTRANIEYAYRVLAQITGLAPGVEVRAIYKVSAGGSAPGTTAGLSRA